MRRAPFVLLLLLVLAAAPAGAAAQDPSAAPPPLRATLAACATGPTEAERFAIFTGSMPAQAGTIRMAMRFELLVRSSSRAPWSVVRAKGFGRWQRSDPGRAGFVYTKRVERLAQAAEYRAVVRFRWSQADGSTRIRVRRTGVCRQPDQRPNLRVESLTASPGPQPGTTRLRIVVLNGGRSAAGGFDVSLSTPDGPQSRTVAGLPAGERATLDVVVGACDPRQPFTVLLDAGRAVEESSERDNRVVRPCDGAR